MGFTFLLLLFFETRRISFSIYFPGRCRCNAFAAGSAAGFKIDGEFRLQLNVHQVKHKGRSLASDMMTVNKCTLFIPT